MRNGANTWYTVLSISGILLLLSINISCSKSEYAGLRDYLKQVDKYIGELEDIDSKFGELVEEEENFRISEFASTIVSYKHKYNDLLVEFKAIDCPEDALQLQKYTIEIMELCVDSADMTLKYYYSPEYKYIDRIESNARDARNLVSKAADEWDRLTELTGPVHGPYSLF